MYTLYNFYINLKIPVKKVSLQFLEFILFNNKNISVKKKSVINNFNKSISSQKALKERTARIFSRDVIARICRNEYAKSWSFLDLRKARKAIWNEIETKPWLPAWLTRLRPYWERFVRSFVPTHLQRIDLARQCCFADSSTTRDRFHVRKSISHLSRIIKFCTEISKLIAFFFSRNNFLQRENFYPSVWQKLLAITILKKYIHISDNHNKELDWGIGGSIFGIKIKKCNVRLYCCLLSSIVGDRYRLHIVHNVSR